MQKAGLVKSIGVANYGTSHLDELRRGSPVPPVLNQVEVSPFLARQKSAKVDMMDALDWEWVEMGAPGHI